MASAYSSLRKMKKLPLPGIRTSSNQRMLDDNDTTLALDVDDITTSMLLDEVTKDIVGARVRNTIRSPIYQHGLSLPAQSSRRSTVTPPTNVDLMTSMTSRLTSLESQVRLQSKQLAEKDKKIENLQQKVNLLSASDENKRTKAVIDLEQRCHRLQKQVNEMEEFLADYGMLWVGDTELSDSEDYEDANHQKDDAKNKSQHFSIDFNLLVAKLNELNFLSGEGIAKIQRTVAGARLKIPDPVNFIIYNNGLILFNGPFRSFADCATQQLIQDIVDGYFPTELQSRFPDGVVFKLTDKRDVHFKDTMLAQFEGEGHVLGGKTTRSYLLQSNTSPVGNAEHATCVVETTVPGPKMNMDQFLHRLPRTVIKSGKVIDIRSSVRQSLCSSETRPMANASGSQCSESMHSMAPVSGDENQANDSHDLTGTMTTLKVKMEDGNSVLILRLKNTDTIGDVKKHINNKQKAAASRPYDIVSGFPAKVHKDNDATLEQCGLIPSALLYIRHRK